MTVQPVDNTANNGIITAALISSMANTINGLIDFCEDLGLNQTTVSKKSFLTRLESPNVLAYGAENTRIFTGRYAKAINNATGKLVTFDVKFWSNFSSNPHISATVEQDPSKAGVFAYISNITKDGCKVHLYNPNASKYNGNIVVNVIAVGIEA